MRGKQKEVPSGEAREFDQSKGVPRGRLRTGPEMENGKAATFVFPTSALHLR